MTWDEKVTRYEHLVAQCERFEKKGKTVPYTSANGHMFSLINKEGELGFRYSKEVQEKYFDQYQTTFLKSHGATMNGYILITEPMFKDQDNLIKMLNESYDFVMSLPKK